MHDPLVMIGVLMLGMALGALLMRLRYQRIIAAIIAEIAQQGAYGTASMPSTTSTQSQAMRAAYSPQ